MARAWPFLCTALLPATCGATGPGSPPAPCPETAEAIAPLDEPAATSQTAARRLVEAAVARSRRPMRYDGGYRRIPYPGGDVPDGIGVCTDLVIRSYRALGIDLQRAVHEDISRAFSEYPRIWGLARPDPNIDHRRVPNLRVFLRRQGAALEPTRDPRRYRPGDLVTWRLRNGPPHIGIVADRHSADGERPLVVHNIGRGPEVEDALLDHEITGHYRYLPVAPD